MKAVFLLMLAAGVASAQNSDLGLLLGISTPSTEVIAGSQGRIHSSVGGSGQINFAFQLRESSVGRLYLELPLLIGGRTESTVSSVVSSSVQTNLFFTPGVRYNFNVHPRVSLYAALGAGINSTHDDESFVGKGVVSVHNGWSTGAIGAVGGGLDFRLTRLVSLRGEVRDFFGSRNRAVFGIGLGFHW